MASISSDVAVTWQHVHVAVPAGTACSIGHLLHSATARLAARSAADRVLCLLCLQEKDVCLRVQVKLTSLLVYMRQGFRGECCFGFAEHAWLTADLAA